MTGPQIYRYMFVPKWMQMAKGVYNWLQVDTNGYERQLVTMSGHMLI